MYNRRPVGQYFIQVCTNVACNLCGADDVVTAFCEFTGSETGQLSSDGLFTIMEAECLGACGFPTAVQIDDRYFENVTPDDVPRILDQLRNAAGARKLDLGALPEAIRRTVEFAGDHSFGHGHVGEAR